MTCSNCRWLDAPSEERKQDGHIKAIRANRAYPCKVQFDLPSYPKCVRIEMSSHWMCASYGEGCQFHTPLEHTK